MKVVIDFETNGNGVNKKNDWKPYDESEMPLPRPNYPIELSACLFDDDGNIHATHTWIIKGATRLDPWVLEHVPNASIENCNTNGLTFVETLKQLKSFMNDECMTIIGHNIEYDYKDVLMTVDKEEEDSTELIDFFGECPTFCTCVNDFTLKAKNPRPMAYYYYKIQKWIGPRLGQLAQFLKVEYDDEKAHSSAYDVDITYQCYLKIANHQK